MTATFNLTFTEICESALENVGVIAEGQSATPSQLVIAKRIANLVKEEWANKGIKLWATEEVLATLTASSEVIGTDSTVYRCIEPHTAAASNQPITGAGYLNNWTTNGVTGAGAAWVLGSAYTSIGVITPDADTLDILNATIKISDNIEYPLELINNADYMAKTNKSDVGQPYQLYFDYKTAPKIRLFPQPDQTTYILKYTRLRRLADLTNATDYADMKANWLSAFIFEISYKLTYKFPVSPNEQQALKAEAAELFFRAQSKNTSKKTDNFIRPCY